MKKNTRLCILIALLPFIASSHAEENGEGQVRKPLPDKAAIAKLPPDGGEEFNRLIHETSPYLRQHARNPVDWYPWGKEAFDRARKENKPVFLSVGYSSCHWCHVMEHESFEDDEVAAILNKHFISVKVDREERPDIDQIYMNATQIVTGRGGWPNSVMMDADQRPFFCGTYFPKVGRGGSPGFISLLNNIHDVWTNQRERVDQSAAQISEALKQMAYTDLPPSTQELNRDIVDPLLTSLKQTFDRRDGGFGGAPKFPPHQVLTFLLYEYQQNQNEEILELLNLTLTKMAKGGIYDHVGGGFHRYATDAIWFLPHFEKMLYDNAQLSRVYAEAYKVTGNEWYKDVAHGINSFVLRDLLDKNGGFHSAYDADSEGEEGKYYLWTSKQVEDVLGKERAATFSAAYDVTEAGNYYEEATRERKPINIPHLSKPLNEHENADSLKAALIELRKHRDTRVWPMLDDKVLTSWNGIMIGALAYSGNVLEEPKYIAAAKRAADFILKDMKQADGRLHATYRDGTSKLNAYLDDYAFLANGLLDLYEVTNEKRYLDEAQALMDVLQKHFTDGKSGGFYFTSSDHENLLSRNKDPFDGAIPSGNGIAAQVFVRLATALDNENYQALAKKSFSAFEPLITKSPRSAVSMVQAIAMYYDQTDTPVVSSSPDAKERHTPVTVSAFLSGLRVPPGGSVDAAVQLTIDDGWHVYGNKLKQAGYTPTKITIADHPSFLIKRTAYPATTPFKSEVLGTETGIYEGAPVFRSRLSAKADAEPGVSEIAFTVQFQACDDQVCQLAKEVTLKIPITIDPAAKKADRHPTLFK